LPGKLSDEGRSFLEAALPHLDVVYRVARHMNRDHHGAEDLVQETYLRAYAAFESHHGPSTRAWLITICLNLARSEGRRRARRPVEAPLTEREADLAGAPGAAGAGVPEEAMANIDRASVSRALSRLPEDQRLAIVLMDLAGLTASEVAGMLSCPRNTVLSRVHRGHQRLATLLIEEDVNR
jgi:RNA polymerase sigma-70 factor, ECF subfamily